MSCFEGGNGPRRLDNTTETFKGKLDPSFPLPLSPTPYPAAAPCLGQERGGGAGKGVFERRRQEVFLRHSKAVVVM
ncbi:hypothetical protein E2C01_085374 [Portunus trituberculatus]|uniref:Uncharacterized protein n=1 Tax=Portunus trituberculatus TaxID=210409 RepID=A0A5B7J0T4_PORTR|nr:hypothetical protein [Portunus trituberculatus]